MRVTTFSAAAMVLVAAGLAIFWPGQSAGPGVAAVVAQDPDEAKRAGKAADSAGPEKKQQEQPLEGKLDKKMDAEFIETTFRDVLEFVENSSGIQFYVKRKHLDEAGVSEDTPITKQLKQVRVRTLLDLMLEELNLTYYEKDDLIVITSREDAESTLEIRVYDCRDLLAIAEPAGAGEGAGPAPGVGIPGSGTPGGGAPGAFFGNPGPALPQPGELPAAPGAGFPPAPSGLEPAAGSRGPTFPVPPKKPGKEIMPQFGGAAAGRGEGGPAGARGGMPMGGMGMPGMAGPGAMMGGYGGGSGSISPHDQRAMRLMNIITTAVDPNSWSQEMGGPGTISEYDGLIVITQTAQTHKKVERVLDMLREAAGLEVVGMKKVVR